MWDLLSGWVPCSGSGMGHGGQGHLWKVLSAPHLQKANKGQSRAIERLKKKMFENEFWLLLNSPAIPFRIHNRNGKVRRAGWGRAQPCLHTACHIPLSLTELPLPALLRLRAV